MHMMHASSTHLTRPTAHRSNISSQHKPSAPVFTQRTPAVPRQRHQQQQHVARRQLSHTQRHLVARVRLQDLEESSSTFDAVGADALQTYMQLEQTGELNNVTAGNLRLKYGIKRNDDGRVQVRRSNGVWMQVKLDMEVAGTLLLRDSIDEKIFVLQTDRLKQIDLSDDYVLLMMFADGNWEQQAIPITLVDGDGTSSQLEMGEQEFKDYVGLIKTLQDAEKAMREGGMGADEEEEEEEDEEDDEVADDDDGVIDVAAEVQPSKGASKP